MADHSRKSYPGPILDSHAHIFPETIAAKAIVSIGEFYGLPMAGGSGTLADLLAAERQAGIVQTVIFSTATSMKQVDPINRFMSQCQETEPAVAALGTLHPDMPDAEVIAELTKIEALGLYGVKLHPDFQRVAADSPFVIHATRAMAGRLPLLIHAGDRRQAFSQPPQIRALALACPETTIIAAHLGGWSQWREAAELLAGLPNIYVDTSSSLKFLSDEDALRQIRSYDPGHILFGTDYPMWSPLDELDRFFELALSENERAAILWENGRSLLKLSNPAF